MEISFDLALTLQILYFVLSYILGYLSIRWLNKKETFDSPDHFIGLTVLWLLSPLIVPFIVIFLILYGIGKFLGRK